MFKLSGVATAASKCNRSYLPAPCAFLWKQE